MISSALLALLLLGSNASRASTFVTQTIEADPKSIEFVDDLNFKLLDTAVQRQINAYDSTLSLSGRVKFGTRIYPKSVLRDSLVLFQELARQNQECMRGDSGKAVCQQRFNEAIQARFRVFRPKSETSRYTAYYSPDFNGSLVPRGKYQLPLYSAPSDPALKESTREAITYSHALEGKGLECAYIDADLFELYSLQIEGGGRIRLFDEEGKETVKYISYHDKNALPLRFFSKLMLEHGWLTAQDLSYSTQHKYFLDHPEVQRKLYSESPSYVYFKLTDEEPLGISSIPLTENRSTAYDPAFFPAPGVLNFIRVTVNGKEITRFMLGQDVGGAIKGPARADLYFGFGEEARIAAESLGAEGKQYFLIKRDGEKSTLGSSIKNLSLK
jgi:membrane-bound lytic murein transglycosylase A